MGHTWYNIIAKYWIGFKMWGRVKTYVFQYLGDEHPWAKAILGWTEGYHETVWNPNWPCPGGKTSFGTPLGFHFCRWVATYHGLCWKRSWLAWAPAFCLPCFLLPTHHPTPLGALAAAWRRQLLMSLFCDFVFSCVCCWIPLRIAEIPTCWLKETSYDTLYFVG